MALQVGRDDRLEKWLIARVLKSSDLDVPLLHTDFCVGGSAEMDVFHDVCSYSDRMGMLCMVQTETTSAFERWRHGDVVFFSLQIKRCR